jgi:peptidoglycan/xylan/chitin deacetylase (PgdA/CDA1 family)
MRFFRSPLIARLLFSAGQWKGDDNSAVYLTFDDGPTPEVTLWVLNFLKEEKIKATFFLIGKNVQQNPEIVTQLLADGHRIGNHTMNHECGTKSSLNAYIDSVNQADQFMETELFRPPYGKITMNQFRTLLSKGKKIVFWSWISYDFDKNISPQEIIQKAKKIRGGDILVFHDSLKGFTNMSKSLKTIVDEIRSKKMEFKTL